MPKLKNMEFVNNIKQLFATVKTEQVPIAPIVKSSESRQEGETYRHWGLRICGIVESSLNALTPYLHNVYNYIYREQAENKELQEQARKNTQAEIEQKNVNIEECNTKIRHSCECIDDNKSKSEELKNEKQTINESKEKINKDQRLHLIIGLFIIIPLTVYLFLFYSSTFYSAFFADVENMGASVLNSMFDPHALNNAYKQSWTELLFVLSAPIIFLGLGFGLYSFSMQKGKGKYLKIVAILLVTVTFDGILAYKIGKNLHELGMIFGQITLGERYTFKLAFTDVNTWAVIFCGFIVYIIWGVVFDMCMTAYHAMDLNKTRLESISKEICTLEEENKNHKIKINELENEISKLKNDIKLLTSKLGHQVYIDYTAIRTEMNNFFSGWITQMQVFSCSLNEQTQAQSIFNQTVNTLIFQKQ